MFTHKCSYLGKKNHRKVNKKRNLIIILVVFLTLTFIIDFSLSSNQLELTDTSIHTQTSSLDFYDNVKLSKDEYSESDDLYNVDNSIQSYTNEYLGYESFNESEVGTIENGYYYSSPDSFNDESLGIYSSQPDLLDFIDSYTERTSMYVEILNYLEHKHVLSCSGINIYNSFSQQTFGTIEFYTLYRSGDTNLYISDDTHTLINMKVGNGQIIMYYGDGLGGQDSTSISVPINQFSRIKIIFDTDNDNYTAYINEIEVVTNENFIYDYTSVGIKKLGIICDYNKMVYYDAVGYSFDGYSTNKNLYQDYSYGYLPDFLKANQMFFTQNSSIQIENEYNGHNYVLNISDNSEYGYGEFYINTNTVFGSNYLTGSFSFWINFDNYDYINPNYLAIRSYDTNGGYRAMDLQLNYDNGKCKYFYNGGSLDFYADFLNNTWINVCIDFNSISETYDIYFNYKLIMENIPYYDSIAYDYGSIYLLRFIILKTQIGNIYFDGFDFSWSEGYYYQRNFEPVIELQEGYQIESNEFDYLSSDFETNATRIKQIDTETRNQVQLNRIDDFNSQITITSNPSASSTYYSGIEWNVNSEGLILTYECSFVIYYANNIPDTLVWSFYLDNGNYFYLAVVNYTDSKIYFQVKDLIESAYISLLEIDTYTTYNIKLLFNIQDNYYTIQISSFTDNVEFKSNLDDTFDSFTSIEKIRLTILNSNVVPSDMKVGINSMILKRKDDYNVIYDYTPYEYGLFRYDVGLWYFREFNLLDLDLDYDNKIVLYQDYDFENPITLIDFPSRDYETTFNLYSSNTFTQTILGIKAYGNFSNPNKVRIHGVGLEQNSQKLIGWYYTTNVNQLDNYYFVKQNKLYYHFRKTKSGRNETMSIRFLIDDYYIYNDAITFTGYCTKYNGSITIKDTDLDVSETFDINRTLQNHQYNITTLDNSNLDELWININVYNGTSYSGYNEGYITNLKIVDRESLYDFPEVSTLGLSFSEGLIFVLIRLALFLIPSLLVYFLFKKGFLPIFFMLEVVFLIVGFIPFWLFIVNVIAFIGMIIIPKNENIDESE